MRESDSGVEDVLDKDVLFEVLASSRRRLLLYHLHRRGGEANLVDLAADVAAAETDGEIEEEVEKRHYISLYQTHVPKLEEIGFVVYDEDNRQVELTDRVLEISQILGGKREQEPPWPLYYGTIASIGFLLGILSLAGFTMVPASIVAVVFFGLLLVLAAYHYVGTADSDLEHSVLETLVDE
ncbi:hypothetical protein RH858_16015 [Halalkaliarchaeum sp. AArc-GB]|uniref:DUF7344 domain-containing protein n=1 Tax=Halalkaliarchaeum sp. AArc-GB TaxID=3074078 RepID=UPI002861EB44|nr:hypothetical protein [Halalkaliarchaeum sp. AArc-GB]MDR5674631.1 hypothetical protein [Halalkaliarchaeum sp. AArc-GB]